MVKIKKKSYFQLAFQDTYIVIGCDSPTAHSCYFEFSLLAFTIAGSSLNGQLFVTNQNIDTTIGAWKICDCI